MPETRFALDYEGEELAARLDVPEADAQRSAILLACGSGSHMETPWMRAVTEGLVARGFPVMRFHYRYRQRALHAGRSGMPDRTPVLEGVHTLAVSALRSRVGPRRLLLAGKSMGGRISTLLAAKGEHCAGLVLFGYPLHPPKKPEKSRSEHFPTLVQPALFLQGTRDEFAGLELLNTALERYGGRATLEVIEGADHGFHVLKKSGRTDEEVRELMLDRVDRWERETFP